MGEHQKNENITGTLALIEEYFEKLPHEQKESIKSLVLAIIQISDKADPEILITAMKLSETLINSTNKDQSYGNTSVDDLLKEFSAANPEKAARYQSLVVQAITTILAAEITPAMNILKILFKDIDSL